MERFGREQAHTLDMDDLQAIIDTDSMNPCIERLIYVETRKTERKERSIYPCYPAQIKEKDGVRSVIFFVNQCMAGQYNTACVSMPENEFGVKARFWNLPPNEDVLEKEPMISSVEVQ